MKVLVPLLTCLLAFSALPAQEKTNKKTSGYVFSPVKSAAATPVQNQGRTGTCWIFSSLSFFESELMRMGKGADHNLSEMFVVRQAYPVKASNYLRMHGKAQFGEGGQFHDALYVLRNYGAVPQEVYNGNSDPEKGYNHKEMDSVLLQQVKALAGQEKINTAEWQNQVEHTLDNYLGKAPATFSYKGKNYSPQSYAQELGLKADDYVVLTSFTHHPFYQPFVLEVPDNWAWQQVQNVQLDELVQTVNHALDKGYTVAWDADVSEDYFRHKEGLALLPEGWNSMNAAARQECFAKPVKQQEVSPQYRQEAFDNYETQDDHLMHITGRLKDQNGTVYYEVKNSWGSSSNECRGYLYVSEAYFRYKTINIMLHKKAVPPALLRKMGVKA